nr:immunoglobulin heavy chain junction region [Macaca mulatta]MOY23118.1 immunoglobulin heavy chain junction region [Macaca mulatta]MOY23359.1 immunoglobulin heavy chain junction region [Macaca mulatta]MOY23450.1 immunoglobulin heavy chain junction region [Macaca mulatta]MOY23624.1 immunoglobulin heavy chain junction region [Macaca mulatta]
CARRLGGYRPYYFDYW